MKNKNIYIMKQPALGKKIFELRKQKGLTQEELVEKCNINVRTIQRIEAGETSPRSYTIKTILNALGEEYEVVEEKIKKVNFETTLGVSSVNIKKVLKLSWILGIVYFIFGFVEFTSEYFRIEHEVSVFSTIILALVKVISITTFFFFMRGFTALGKVYENNLLTIISIITIVTFSVFGVIEIAALFMLFEWIYFILIIKMLLFGLLTVMLGISVALLHKQIGVFALVTGVVEIIAGLFLLMLSAEKSLSIIFPMQLLEILLIYFACAEINKKELVYS